MNFVSLNQLQRAVLKVASIPFLAVSLSAAPIQSPIDIRSENSIYGPLQALEFSYSSSTPFEVLNNGSPGFESTIKGNVPAGAGNLTVGGTIWPLLQFHFHTQSEHALNGNEFDMELHMVHQLPTSEYLVVGRFITIGAFNSALDPIFSDIPPNAGETRNLLGFDLNGLLPSSLNSYRYTGSLTTPAFTEGVNWVILAEALELSAGQVQAFRNIFPAGNERELQALNGRFIQTDVVGFSSVPEPSSSIFIVTGIGLLIVRRFRHHNG
jgi:carbonic anhydrase